MKITVTRVTEATYVELVRTVFTTLLPTTIMAISFPAVGLVIARQEPDRFLMLLIVLGSIAMIVRLAIVMLYRREAADPAMTYLRARILERRFAASYFLFAAIFGAFAARAFAGPDHEAHMLVVALLFGYGAGVAAGLALRLWICLPAIVIAIAPTLITAAFTPELSHRVAALLLGVFTLGGIQSMVKRYRAGSRGISMRLFFTTLARHDELTGLPNRLCLHELFADLAAGAGGSAMLAVHCLDLDRFKPVNDLYGHPVGDALLRAVSERLTGLLRPNDFAARLGGDEFVLVQTGTGHPDEADLLARRIVRAIGQPFLIEGHEIVIGTSVGYALARVQGSGLDRLLADADAALCQVKREGGGIAAYSPPPPAARMEHRLIA